MQQQVHQSWVYSIDEVKQCLLNLCHGMDHSASDNAFDEWHKHLHACVCVDLPRKYLLKLLAAEILSEVVEKSLEYDENLLSTLSADDIRRLHSARATFK